MTLVSQFVIRFASKSIITGNFLLSFDKHSMLVILFGPSGCGKTTVLRCIAGLEKPDYGFIKFYNDVWFCSESSKVTPTCRRNIGYVFQDAVLFPHLNVRQNIVYGIRHLSFEEQRNRVDELVDLIGLSKLLCRKPSEISGGQRQRVALARALAPKPRLLLLDEPFISLDRHASEKLRNNLQQILEHSQIPTILVTHNQEEALNLGNWMLVMSNGHVINEGVPSKLLK